jgi:thiamine biosynthesis lipoprotein ApbE
MKETFSVLTSESTSYFVGGETNSRGTRARKKLWRGEIEKQQKTQEFSPITSIHCRSRSTKQIEFEGKNGV